MLTPDAAKPATAATVNRLQETDRVACHHIPASREWWHREARAGGTDWNGWVPLWWAAMQVCRHCGLTPLDEPMMQEPAPLPDPEPRPTPRTTIEAIMYCVRERGPAALKEPANVARLNRCDKAALAEIDRRTTQLRGSS